MAIPTVNTRSWSTNGEGEVLASWSTNGGDELKTTLFETLGEENQKDEEDTSARPISPTVSLSPPPSHKHGRMETGIAGETAELSPPSEYPINEEVLNGTITLDERFEELMRQKRQRRAKEKVRITGNHVAENDHSVDTSEARRCKRTRLPSLLHASFPQCAPHHVDRLQSLYPHPRDRDCHLDDKLHQYQVLGQPYSLSVSGWWKKYFEDFAPTRTSTSIVQRYIGNPGFRVDPGGRVTESVLVSSVYNFAQHIRVLERRGDNDFLDALRSVAIVAEDDYARRQCRCPCSTERIVEFGRKFLMWPRKPEGPSCYYLMLLYTADCGPEKQALHMTRTWEIHGKLESLKGTYMHKKIELFINAMVAPMERDGSLQVAVEDLLREQPPSHEYAAEAVLRQIAWAQDPELWNHPLASASLRVR